MAVLASGILILVSLLLQSLMKNIHYTILKTIGSFSAIVAPFSLGVVVFVPSEDLNLIAYTVLCVIFVGLLYLYSLVSNFACAYHQEKWNFNSYPVHWSFLLVILVPLLITSALFFSRSSSGFIIITFPHFNAYYILRTDIDANGVIWRKCERLEELFLVFVESTIVGRIVSGIRRINRSNFLSCFIHYISLYREPKFLIKMPPRKNRTLNEIHKQELEDHVIARMEERFDQFVDQLSDRMDQLMNRRGNRNSQGTDAEQSDNPFGEDDDQGEIKGGITCIGNLK
ncbi:hypothetical protein Tco_0458066 [Tanacetum coccineum]